MREREIGGKVSKLSSALDQTAQDRVAKLNPDKCVFGVEAGKFLGFLLTERGIEANPKKHATIVAMRSPSSVREVQQLAGRMTALSRFVSAGGDKGHPYQECKKAFLRLKEYLASHNPVQTATKHIVSPVFCSD